MTKEYLGDSVYIEVDDGMFKITTEDGRQVSNTIYLEPAVYQALVRYTTKAFADAEQLKP